MSLSRPPRWRTSQRVRNPRARAPARRGVIPTDPCWASRASARAFLPALFCLLAGTLLVATHGAIAAGPAAADPSRGRPHGTREATLERDPDPVLVEGSLLAGVLGVEIDRLNLFAYRHGRFVPVPFQIDEHGPDGRLLCPLGPQAEQDTDAGRLDGNDELVFMAADTGDLVPPEARPATWERAEQIEVEDPLTGARGWCTLALPDHRPRRSGTDYIDYLPEEDTYVSVYNTGVYHREGSNRADYNKVWYPPAAGGAGVDVVDRLKIRVEIRLKFPPSGLDFSENDMEVDTVSYIDGPVRVVRRNQLFLRVPPFTIPFGGSHDVIVYRDTCDTPIGVHVPKGTSWLMKSLRVSLGTDFSPEAIGMLWYNTWNLEGMIVDGRMSEAEKHLAGPPTSADWNRYWQITAGPQGALMRRGCYGPEPPENLAVSVRYLDDLERADPPEEFPGTLGCATLDLTLTEPSAGTHWFLQQWYMPHHAYPFEPALAARYMNVRNAPLQVRTQHGARSSPRSATGEAPP